MWEEESVDMTPLGGCCSGLKKSWREALDGSRKTAMQEGPCKERTGNRSDLEGEAGGQAGDDVILRVDTGRVLVRLRGR